MKKKITFLCKKTTSIIIYMADVPHCNWTCYASLSFCSCT